MFCAVGPRLRSSGTPWCGASPDPRTRVCRAWRSPLHSPRTEPSADRVAGSARREVVLVQLADAVLRSARLQRACLSRPQTQCSKIPPAWWPTKSVGRTQGPAGSVPSWPGPRPSAPAPPARSRCRSTGWRARRPGRTRGRARRVRCGCACPHTAATSASSTGTTSSRSHAPPLAVEQRHLVGRRDLGGRRRRPSCPWSTRWSRSAAGARTGPPAASTRAPRARATSPAGRRRGSVVDLDSTMAMTPVCASGSGPHQSPGCRGRAAAW